MKYYIHKILIKEFIKNTQILFSEKFYFCDGLHGNSKTRDDEMSTNPTTLPINVMWHITCA